MGGQSSSERKVKKEIDRLLSSERSRGLLIEALLQDRDFTEAYIGRTRSSSSAACLWR